MTNDKVDQFIQQETKWKSEFTALRKLLLQTELDEDYKWGKPCYSYHNQNIVLIHGFKEYCALLFMQGALLNDPHNILIQQTDNVQAARQIRFKNLDEINNLEPYLMSYIDEAIQNEKEGRKVILDKSTDFEFPIELQTILDNDEEFKIAFDRLTPGRKRAYNLFFSAPKQSKTREARIEKYREHILNGKGMNDK